MGKPSRSPEGPLQVHFLNSIQFVILVDFGETDSVGVDYRSRTIGVWSEKSFLGSWLFDDLVDPL